MAGIHSFGLMCLQSGFFIPHSSLSLTALTTSTGRENLVKAKNQSRIEIEIFTAIRDKECKILCLFYNKNYFPKVFQLCRLCIILLINKIFFFVSMI